MPSPKIVTLISETDWLKEIERLTAKNVDGFTARDLAAQSGHGVAWAQKRIRQGIDSGRLEYAGRRGVPDISGRTNHVPVYRLVR